jgi:hypothetical protein
MNGSEEDKAQALTGEFACLIGILGVGFWVFTVRFPGDGAVFIGGRIRRIGSDGCVSRGLYARAARVGNVCIADRPYANFITL